jgi:hypothetical protein
MAMTWNYFFPKNQIPLIVAWMVYVKVVLGVPNNKVDNVPPYWLDKFVLANPLTPPKIHSPFTSIPLVFTRRHHVLPWSALVIPPFLFSIGTTNTNYSQNNEFFCIQDLDLVLNDQIVQPPWEQTPWIIVKHGQPHGCSIFWCYGSNPTRNQPKCKHFIYDYMQLVVVCDYIWKYLQLQDQTSTILVILTTMMQLL